MLTVELITQAIRLGTLNQRPDKYPIHTIDAADIGVVTLAAQGFLKFLRTLATGQTRQLHRPADRQAIGIQLSLRNRWRCHWRSSRRRHYGRSGLFKRRCLNRLQTLWRIGSNRLTWQPLK